MKTRRRIINIMLAMSVTLLISSANIVNAETESTDVNDEITEITEESTEESKNNNEIEEDTVDTNWVYDETQTVSEDTVKMISELNENELKVNQYGVVIVKTMNGENIDRFKLDLFNSLGVGHEKINAGILFVIATEDRNYGIEIGDGLQGRAREILEDDLVGKIAIDEMIEGNWDGAVRKVSEALPKVVAVQELSALENQGMYSISETDEAIEIIKPIVYSLMAIPVALGAIFTISLIHDSIKVRSFMNSDYVLAFIDMNNFSKKSLKREMKSNGYSTINKRNLYEYSLDKIKESLEHKYKDSDSLDYDIIKEAYPYSEFEKNARSSLKRVTDNVKREYDVYLSEKAREVRIFKDHVKQNIIWVREIVREEGIDSPGVLEMTLNEVKELPKLDKNELRDWMLSNEKSMIAEHEIYKLFSEEDAKRIIKDIREEDSYKSYINGEVQNFVPQSDDYNRRYFDESGKEKSSLINKNNYWLWIYGLNHRRIQKSRSSYTPSNSYDSNYSSSSKSSSSSNPSYTNFGSGFGGGFSSGGGSSGSF